MHMRLNLDDDIMRDVQRDLDPDSEWFQNLPAKVQLRKLLPYVERQDVRDRARLREVA